MDKPIDIVGIMELLPHRYPFILIDRILEIIPGEKVIALKNVTMNEHFFQGHFPNNPIMPGVMVLEGLGQTGGVLAYKSMPKEKQGAYFYFMSMDRVRFRKPVRPGDQLILMTKLLKLRSNAVKMDGVATVNDEIVVEAQMMAAIGDKL